VPLSDKEKQHLKALIDADRTLELTSALHDYPQKGCYKIAVKVIDIFGNDTTKVVEVVV
jgi:hypothetical protein